jgi:hypothetical protein
VVPAVQDLIIQELELDQAPSVGLVREDDQDGVPLDVLEVVIPLAKSPLSLARLKAVRSAIQALIAAQGNQGFVHLRFCFDPRQQAAEWPLP